jgi:hypothetical protein
MTNQLSTGAGFVRGRWRIDLAYTIDPSKTERVGTSALLSGEYSKSSVRIALQSFGLNTSFRF